MYMYVHGMEMVVINIYMDVDMINPPAPVDEENELSSRESNRLYTVVLSFMREGPRIYLIPIRPIWTCMYRV